MRRIGLCLAILLAAAFAADPGLAGRYAGDWKSGASGSGGALQFALDGPRDETWKCDLTFSLDGAEVRTTMREVKVQEKRIELTYDFDAGGAALRSHVSGEWDGAKFRGQYETTMGGVQVDAGTWTAAPDKKE